jgi:geranylgeranyl pyrophosphate synthase
VGIEIYRHCILIHDDLIDLDACRRGGRTIHSAYAESRDSRFGEGIAVFLGNIAYSLSSFIIGNSGFPEEKTAKALLLLSRGYREVNESQILDLLFEYEDIDVEEWSVMASKRAASLFKVTMLTGAVLSGAPAEDLKKIEEAAENMGFVFDIQDDIIDTFAEEEEYGKPPCRDIMMRKKPLHVICTLNSEDKESSEALRRLLGKRALSSDDIHLIREAIRKSGGLEAAKKISRKHAEKARTLIHQTSLSPDAKKFFRSLIDYIDESLDWYK